MKPKKTDSVSMTIALMMPQWCQNISNNIQTIKTNNNLSKFICKSYPYCWKLSKLKMYTKSNKDYNINLVTNECKLTTNQIMYIDTNQLYDYNFAGSDMCNGCSEYTQMNKPCLVIGGGPSINKYKHIDLLKKYGFNGDIISVDSITKKLLEAEIIPKYMNSLDSQDYVTNFIDHDIIHKYSDKITGLFSTVIHPTINNIYKGKKVFYSPYINKEYNTFLFLMTNTPIINTGGNVGSASIMLAYFLGYNPIIFIGMDLSWEAEEDMKQYYIDNTSYFNPNNIPKDWSKVRHTSCINPIYNKKYYMDIIFESYKLSTLYNLKEISAKGIKLINCTEQGALHSKEIINMKFEEFLKTQNKYAI